MRPKVLFLIGFMLCLANLLAQERSAVLCSDGIDNDGDGLIDCLDDDCSTLPNGGCLTCFSDGLSFADTVINFLHTCPGNMNTDPQNTIGVSDEQGFGFETSFSLGDGGFITLGFTNNALTNSGDENADLFVFEIGSVVEPMIVELRPFDQNTFDILSSEGIPDADADGYFDFGQLSGGTSSLDIDAMVIGYVAGVLKFDAIQILDPPSGTCDEGSFPGVDIDAVCALSSINVDCSLVSSTAILDECGVCLEPGDPNFNQTCVDCNGTLNGSAVFDECGLCLEPNDPNFNQSCVDCSGTPNGTAVLDECGVCLEPNDLNFNQSCADCSGTPNGTAMFDDCGLCIERDNPSFNLSCSEDIYIPNAFSPNDDGVNDRFVIFKRFEALASVKSYNIFDRWGGLLYQADQFEFDDNIKWWDGETQGKDASIGVYVYAIEIAYQNGKILELSGDIQLVR